MSQSPHLDIGRVISSTIASEAAINAINRGFANVLYSALMRQIASFEKTLKSDEEIGAYLASFGTEIIVQIESVSYSNPYFIIFEGINTNDGSKVRLVQHVFQTNVLFTAVKLKELNRSARRIGFVEDEKPEETNQADSKQQTK